MNRDMTVTVLTKEENTITGETDVYHFSYTFKGVRNYFDLIKRCQRHLGMPTGRLFNTKREQVGWSFRGKARHDDGTVFATQSEVMLNRKARQYAPEKRLAIQKEV